jgi:hypothetical protein
MVSEFMTLQNYRETKFKTKNLLRYDSPPPKYTTFHHLVYVARWSPTNFRVFLFLKNKIKWGTTLPHR